MIPRKRRKFEKAAEAVERVMQDDANAGHPILAAMLRTLAAPYGALMKLRRNLYRNGCFSSVLLPCPVISVGNLTLGGTGKTPLVMHLSEFLRDNGFRPAVVSRGHGGTARKTGGVASDGKSVLLDASAAGDEPCMMARQLAGVPVLVGKNRSASGKAAIRDFNADVILLDDGFQHLAVQRDLNLLLMDAARPFGNGRGFPAGILREPLSAIRDSHAVIFTRGDRRPDPASVNEVRRFAPDARRFTCRNRPILRCLQPAGCRRPDASGLDGLPCIVGKKAFVFSGVARNADVVKSCQFLGCRVVGHRGFSDHHDYTESELKGVDQTAVHAGASLLFTTEKDAARIPETRAWPLDLAVAGVSPDFGDDADAFHEMILKAAGRALEKRS